MKMSKILLVFMIGLISLNVIFAGTTSKTFLIKGDLAINSNLASRCGSGLDWSQGPETIDHAQVDQTGGGSNLSGTNDSDTLYFGLPANNICKLEIYTPNNTTTPIYSKSNLNASAIKFGLNQGIVIGPITITSKEQTINFIVKVKGQNTSNQYTNELLTTTIRVPNPNSEDTVVAADTAAWSALAEEAESLVGGQGTGTTSVIAPAMTAGTCTLSNDREFKNVDGTLKYCFGDQGEWVDVRELYISDVGEGVLNIPVVEPSAENSSATPVLTRYWDSDTNSVQMRWKRIDTSAIGPGGVIPMADLNISNRNLARGGELDGAILTWDASLNQMTWISKEELYDEIIDVGTDPNYQPILVPNKYASVKFKDGVSSDGVNYYVPIYRLPNLFTIGSVYSPKTSSVPQYFTKNITTPLFFTLNSENNQGSFEVKGYYKPTGATTATNVFTETINGSTLTLNGLNSYSRSVAVGWKPVNSGNGQFYIEVKKTVAGTTNVARTSYYNVHIYDPITASTFIGGACENRWDCDWVHVGWGSFEYLYENNGAIITGINVVVTGGSGIYRYCATESGSTCDPTSLAGTNLGFRLPRLGYTATGYSTVIGKVIVKDLRTNDTYILPQSVEMSCTSPSQTSEYCH